MQKPEAGMGARVFLKKYRIKISLLLILLAAGLLCIYSIGHYSGSNNSNQNRIEQRNDFNGQGSQRPNAGDQTPGVRSTDPNTGNQAPGGQFTGPNTRNQAPGGQFTGPNSGQRMGPSNGSMRGGFSSTGTKYGPQIITYSVIFLAVFILAWYLYKSKKLKINTADARIIILTLLGVGLLLRISAATLTEGHPFDISLFKSWATAAANNLFQVYSNARSSDYPPLYMYVLFISGKIASIPAMSHYYTVLLKLPSIAADIASSLLIYKLARKYLSLELSILVSAFYIFNPAVFINSTFWGQVDSFFTLIVIASVYMLSEGKLGFSAALLTTAVLMKPQGIIFLPVLFFELVRQKSIKSFLKVVISAVSTAVIIILPFSLNKGALWIIKLYASTVGEYPYASVNAFNFFSLIGANYKKDTSTLLVFSYHNWGMIFIVMVTAFSWFLYSKGKSRTMASAAALLQIAGVFAFSSSMHERYLFPAVALTNLAFIYLKDIRLLPVAAGFSATVYINTQYVLFATSNGVNKIAYNPVLFITSFLNVALFIYLAKVLYDIAVRKKDNIGVV